MEYVCLGQSLPELGACLHISSSGAVECKSPVRNTYAIGSSGVVKTVYAGSLEIWLGLRDSIFGEYRRFWVKKDMDQL